jgi:hypothetical protein
MHLALAVLRCVGMLTTIWMPVSSLLVDTPPGTPLSATDPPTQGLS